MALNRRRISVWAATAVLLLGVIVWSFWPRPVLVDLAAVTHGPFQVSVEDEGRTRARDVYVVSAPIAGRLMRVVHRAGDQITQRNAVVAQLLPTDPAFLDARARGQAEATVKAAEAARSFAAAQLDQAMAEDDYAATELQRIEALAARDLVARAELEAAQLAQRRAEARLDAARSALTMKTYELETVEMMLYDFRSVGDDEAVPLVSLTAPVMGRVLRILQQSETIIPAGTPILEVADPADLEVVAEFLSTDAVKVRDGASATITDWGGPGDLAARVRLVEPSGFRKISALGVEEQRVNIILDIVAPREEWEQLGDGFRVNARIVVSENDDVSSIPLSALFRVDGAWATFTVVGRTAVLTQVDIGQVNDLHAELRAGLAPGDRVIVHPSDRIRDGVTVSERPL